MYIYVHINTYIGKRIKSSGFNWKYSSDNNSSTYVRADDNNGSLSAIRARLSTMNSTNDIDNNYGTDNLTAHDSSKPHQNNTDSMIYSSNTCIHNEIKNALSDSNEGYLNRIDNDDIHIFDLSSSGYPGSDAGYPCTGAGDPGAEYPVPDEMAVSPGPGAGYPSPDEMAGHADDDIDQLPLPIPLSYERSIKNTLLSIEELLALRETLKTPNYIKRKNRVDVPCNPNPRGTDVVNNDLTSRTSGKVGIGGGGNGTNLNLDGKPNTGGGDGGNMDKGGTTCSNQSAGILNEGVLQTDNIQSLPSIEEHAVLNKCSDLDLFS
jgi:hypothetical protein